MGEAEFEQRPVVKAVDPTRSTRHDGHRQNPRNRKKSGRHIGHPLGLAHPDLRLPHADTPVAKAGSPPGTIRRVSVPCATVLQTMRSQNTDPYRDSSPVCGRCTIPCRRDPASEPGTTNCTPR